jgi:hypothetical protein
MLNNPNWDLPSLAGFKEWLEKQPKNEPFLYSDNTICAAAKYLTSIGTDWHSSNGKADQLNSYAYSAWLKACNEDRDVTFGDVLVEIGDNVDLT